MTDVFVPRLPSGLELGFLIEGWIFIIIGLVYYVVSDHKPSGSRQAEV